MTLSHFGFQLHRAWQKHDKKQWQTASKSRNATEIEIL